MAEELEKPDESQSSDAGEISLENIDEILQEEDPGFVDSLNEIKEAGEDASDVELETFNVDVDSAGDDDEKESRLGKVLNKALKKYPKLKIVGIFFEKVGKFFRQRILIWKGKLKLLLFNTLENAKTWPERLKKLGSDFKKIVGRIVDKIKESFSNRNRVEKFMIMVLFFGCGLVAGLTLLNIKKNRWIPFVKRPMLTSLAEVAESKFEYSFENGTLPFLTAFPQAKHNYLFPKVVVNLKTKAGENSFQMGAFEFYVEVDSKDTAIEVKSREVELHDLIQRVAEGFSYNSLQTENGKERLKEEIKKTLNQKIVQGWVKGVYIKFMITKP